MSRERAVNAVPRGALALLLLALVAQGAWHALREPPQARAEDLPPPPPARVLEALSLGDPTALAKLLMLWLQAFDNQPGISIPFRDLDYARVEAWLDRILTLDPRGQYPLLAAARIYADVAVPAKQRQMLEFVYRKFPEDPTRRWRWLAHAAIMARHELKDPALALKYARAITDRARGPGVPFWARDLTIEVLEGMGEVQSARILVGGLLHDGQIQDPHERRFLLQRLKEMAARSVENSSQR